MEKLDMTKNACVCAGFGFEGEKLTHPDWNEIDSHRKAEALGYAIFNSASRGNVDAIRLSQAVSGSTFEVVENGVTVMSEQLAVDAAARSVPAHPV